MASFVNIVVQTLKLKGGLYLSLIFANKFNAALSTWPYPASIMLHHRSEERRVGKENINE